MLFRSEELSNETLRHLRWIHRKVELSQDIFLLGPPGPEKRHLAMAYCELTNRETEIVTLTRDTTESDLKQRREIVSGSALFMNQPPVRAALEGRILVIDGIEAAERNVLPTLNNLLENREMQLEDGRFLVNPRTFDEMAKTMSLEEMTSRGLLRVSEDFRVITISVPVPPYVSARTLIISLITSLTRLTAHSKITNILRITHYYLRMLRSNTGTATTGGGGGESCGNHQALAALHVLYR